MKNCFLESFLLIFVVEEISGGIHNCLDRSSYSYVTELCECEDGYYYNAYEGKCQGVCDYFGDVICGEKLACIQEDTAKEFSCECFDGFIDDGSGNCVDMNQCFTGDVECDGPGEKCENQDGNDICVCDQDYYRTEDGVCQEIDYCMVPGDHPCSQVCNSEDGYGNCSCITGYVYEDDECILDEGYEECECGSVTNWSICSKETSTGTIYCEPKPGFKFTNETSFVVADINECADMTALCPRGSECKNTVGSYKCNCYDDYEYDDFFGECVPKECNPGFAIVDHTCKEFCTAEVGPNCYAGTVCMVNNQNVPSCECLLNCKLYAERNSSSLSIYALSFVVPEISYSSIEGIIATDLYDITLSMEYIFGKGYAQLMKVTEANEGSEVEFNVGFVNQISSPDILLEIARNNCWPVDSEGSIDLCILPSGLIVSEDSFSARNYNPCEEMTAACSRRNAECIGHNDTIPERHLAPGRFSCVCSKGFEQVSHTDDFYCIDINECRNYYYCSYPGSYCKNLPGTFKCEECCNGEVSRLQNELYYAEQEEYSLKNELFYIENEVQDKEQQKIVVAATLGSILGVTLIIVGIGAFILYKIKYT